MESLEQRSLPAASLASYGNIALSFEPNQGRADAHVRFLSHGDGYALFLTDAGAELRLQASGGTGDELRMTLVGANPMPTISGQDLQPGKSNYVIGDDPSQWQTGIANYGRIEYQNVYPGVDLVYYGNQRNLEYDFVVAPGADASAIHFVISGADGEVIDAHGNLVLHTAGGDLIEHAPVLYQEAHGTHVAVAGQYVLDGNDVSFAVGAFDSSLPLVIDPVLNYSTFLGGSDSDEATGIAVSPTGVAYVVGHTASTDFPTTPFALQRTYGGGSDDVFVASISADGTSVLYSTYLGGNDYDYGYGIAVDSSGNAYVAGLTHSTNFPVLHAYQSTKPAFESGFVAKLNAAGGLVYSTFLGGSGNGAAYAIAVDSAGEALVTGYTQARDFPTVNAMQPFPGGSFGDYDAFVTKFGSAGNSLLYSTYLGGNGQDDGYGIAVDVSGNAYIAGTAESTTFPTLNPFQATNHGGNFNHDGFVTKLNSAGQLAYSTYLGGSADDDVNAVAVDSGGNIYVTGDTESTDFPTVAAIQPTGGGFIGDAFITKINPNLGSGQGSRSVVYSTFLGGNGGDGGHGIAVDSAGDALATGFTYSDAGFPVVNAIQSKLLSTNGNAFVSELNAAGNAWVYSTYLGSNGEDHGMGIAFDAAGSAYVTGWTASFGSPDNFPTVHPLQGYAGGHDAFISKLGVPPLTPTQKYVGHVYGDVLQRSVDPASLALWSAQLDHGLPRSVFTNALTHSAEYYATIVAPLYVQFLGRTADAVGLNFWTSQMAHGLTDEELEAGFIGSPEFYTHSGGTDKGWVDAMYADLLNRLPDSSGESFWIQVLKNGTPRNFVALGFAVSSERESIVIGSDYARFLRRTPSSREVSAWVSLFEHGVSNETIVAAFAASDEYFRNNSV